MSLAETQAMFVHVSKSMEESAELLTQADRAVGDGDHGVGMARGFAAVRQTLTGQVYATVGDLLKAVGTAMLSSIGGASGVIFGTLFRGGARNLTDRQTFDATALSLLLDDGLQAIKERGKAKVGDKTMVDALEPAARESRELTDAPLAEALIAVTEAARLGMEKTKDMVATVGKAKALGDRSLTHPDPGAVSLYLILKFMAEYAAQGERC